MATVAAQPTFPIFMFARNVLAVRSTEVGKRRRERSRLAARGALHYDAQTSTCGERPL